MKIVPYDKALSLSYAYMICVLPHKPLLGRTKLLITGVCAVALLGFLVLFTDSQNQTFSFGTFLNSADAKPAKSHTILLSAKSLPNGQLAYKMESHVVNEKGKTKDITSDYSSQPSIPGPIIVVDEGDEVTISLRNDIAGASSLVNNRVSLHVHGVHYDINSDGTLIHVNMIADQGAAPGETRTFHWIAGPGTAGSWPYHDHTFGGINGAEHKGLFGMILVNPASKKINAIKDDSSIETVNIANIKKEFILYLGDDAFWGMEIDKKGKQTPLWVNPTLQAKQNDHVRFHLIALGTDIHEFQMSNYNWLAPRTSTTINKVAIGPLENHQFTVKTKEVVAQFVDNNTSNKLMGMKGTFVGNKKDIPSTPGVSPI